MFKITTLEECEVIAMPTGRGDMIHLVGESDGAQKVDVHINVLAPGGQNGPYHYHEHAENVYWVLSGRGLLTIEGEEHMLEKDNVVFIPPKVRHSLSIVGDEELRLLEIYAPAGKDSIRVE